MEAVLDQYKDFWLTEFSEVHPLDLPVDQLAALHEGEKNRFATIDLCSDDIIRLISLAKQENTTVEAILLTAFNILLGRITNQEDIVVGCLMGEKTVLPVRNFPEGDLSFMHFLTAVSEKIAACCEHKNSYEQLAIDEEISQPESLHDVIFSYSQCADGQFDVCCEEYDIKNLKLGLSVRYDEEQVHMDFVYGAAWFHADTAQRFADYFCEIVSAALNDPSGKIKDIPLLSARERKELLEDFNNTKVSYPPNETVISLFEAQAFKYPNNIAVKIGSSQLSYREINERSGKVASYLTKKHQIGRGDLVGIMLDREEWLVPVIFGILKVGAAYIPIDTKQPAERVNTIIKDSQLNTLITRECFRNRFEFAHAIELENALDEINEQEVFPSTKLEGNDLAYIIYTSGSTGKPKGVMVEHHSLYNIIQCMQQRYPLQEQDSFLLKTTYSFDVSVAELFGWFLNGGSLTILEAGAEADSGKILEAIEAGAVTHVNFVPSMFSLFLESLQSRGIEKIENLKYIFLAGEALPRALVRKFNDLNSSAALENIYGPTEATIYSCGYSTAELPTESMVPIGKPLANINVYILDKYNKLQPVGVPGELCIGGEAVARGYLHNEALTREKFIANPHVKGERIYKTGDLVKWLPDGNIEYLGRIDNQVKIRGFRIELGEIENAFLSFDEVKECVVLARGEEDNKYLICYYVSKKEIDSAILKSHLETKLPHYMVPNHYVYLSALPLTSNGKVNRKSLPDPEINVTDEYVAPRTPTEERLTILWGEVLNLIPTDISVTSSFFSLGGHSLKAGFLVNKIHKEFKTEVSLQNFFRHQHIRSLSVYIDSRSQSSYSPIPKAETKEYYRLSSAQQRLLYLYDLDRSSIAYNIPQYLKLEGKLDKQKLEESFRKLIARHESLRTYFDQTDHGPVQHIAEDFEFTLEVFHSEEKGVPLIAKDFIRPFNLGRAPLIRAGLVEIYDKDDEYLLLIDTHHIINDGVSEGIMIKDLKAFYTGEALSDLPLQYKDYAEWQQSREQQELAQKHKSFWLNEYDDEITPLNLPLDFTRPLIKGYEGNTQNFVLNGKETAALKAIADRMDTTLYTVLLSVFNVLLSRLSNQEDIIVGSPTAGRNHADLENILGMFVNTLPLRNYPQGHLTFSDFVKNVHDRTLASFDHQGYLYEDLVKTLNIERDPARNPLFDVVFSLQNFEGVDFTSPDLSFKSDNKTIPVAKFDLTLEGREVDGQLYFNLEYSTDLFQAETIQRFISYFKTIVSAVIRNSGLRLSEIDILSEAERGQLLNTFNATHADYPKDKTVIELFEKQVNEKPEAIAIVSKAARITYRELNEKANSLAHSLRRQGIKPNDIICIMGGQSPEVIIGMLGILKSGACFLPIDPDYPLDRIEYILQDSGYKALLSHPEVIEKSEYAGEYINLYNPNLYEFDKANPINANTAQDLAYIIYTSGSTGKPKGVMIEHHSLVNLCCWHNENYNVTPEDQATKYAGLGFDASVWEIFPHLLKGASMHMISEEIRLDVEALNDYYNENNITISFLSSQVCEQFVKLENKTLRLLLTGGDKLKAGAGTPYTVVNNYGPTENTVVTTSFAVRGTYQNIPIGKPVANHKIYILGRNNNLSPVGVAGELCVSGAGLARGYLNREELTAEKFVTNPLTGERMYRTGDLARWLYDGNIEFLGRIDSQVKIRGNRIELGEIENNLSACDGVEQAVITVKDKHGDKYLVAYYVSAEEISADYLKNYLNTKLPKYMVPAFYVRLDEIPLTSNGKVNRRVLPEPEIEAGDDFVAPANDIEERLAKVWSEVLNINKEMISATRSFYDTGGHSLNAATMLNKVHKEFDVKISFQEFFEKPTIKLLAEHIEVHTWLKDDDDESNKFEITI